MSVELVFLALTALSLFIFRRGDERDGVVARDTVPNDTVPGHRVTTLLFAAATLAVVAPIVYDVGRLSSP